LGTLDAVLYARAAGIRQKGVSLMKSLLVSLGLVAVSAGVALAQDPNGGGAQVPLPGTLLLLVTGIAGLAAGSWWLRK
jgi:hypothetical protein